MKESYRKGIASHPGAESCVASREAVIEALKRGKCRQGIELRNNRDRSADVVQHGGRQHWRERKREHPLDSAQSETETPRAGTGRPHRRPSCRLRRDRLEKAMRQKSSMHVGGESDGCVVPTKCPVARRQSVSASNPNAQKQQLTSIVNSLANSNVCD
jgi:hypothetical protein